MPSKSSKIPKYILNCVPSQDPQNDWGMESALTADVAAAPLSLPSEVDLREDWWKIGDQRDTGSCVGWGAGDSVIRWHLVKSNRINQDDLLSVRFIWMAAKETDEFNSRPTTFIENEGTSLKAALDVARRLGLVLEPFVPFNSGRLFQGYAKDFYAIASNLRINAYYNLGLKQASWRNWLAKNGPILIRVNVDATWDNSDQTGGRMVAYQPATNRGGHAAALVGYRPDCFIVRNSWGETWGEKGFGYASFAYARDAFTEAYGVYLV